MAGTILIVDGVTTNRIALRMCLGATFYQIEQATSLAEAEERLGKGRLGAVLLGDTLPDDGAMALCRRMRSRPEVADTPVLVLRRDADPAARRAALRAGADDVLDMTRDAASLLARLRSLIRLRHAEQELALRDETGRILGLAEAPSDFAPAARIGLVAQAPGQGQAWRDSLAGAGYPARILGPQDLLGDTGRDWDVLVIDFSHDDPEARLSLLSELRTRRRLRHACVIAAVDAGQGETAARALDLGAESVIPAPVDPGELELRLAAQVRRKRVADRLRTRLRDGMRAAVTDPLTGLYNRRYALPHLGRALEHARSGGRPCAVMIADLDRFKRVNDRHGHAAGDAVLVEVARRLRDGLRAVDFVARTGGEEFLIVLPGSDRTAARSTAERLRALIRDRPIALGGPGERKSVQVTVSIGLVVCDGAGPRPEPQGAPDHPERPEGLAASDIAIAAVLRDADRALYAAKARGRDRIRESRSAA